MPITLQLDFSDCDNICDDKQTKTLVQSLHHNRVSYHDALAVMTSVPKTELRAVTITVGRADIGMLGYKDQYMYLRERIKRRFKYHSDQKYIFFPEIQPSTGNIHFHGYTQKITFDEWKEKTGIFGSRNTHISSFAPVKNKDNYSEYIKKEVYKFGLAPIHNIKKIDVANFKLKKVPVDNEEKTSKI